MAVDNYSDKTGKKRKLYWSDRLYLAYLRDIAFWIVGIILAYSLLFRVVTVSGPSMNTTLVHGDFLLLMENTLSGDPEYGDIVVFDSEKEERNFFKEIKESFQYNIVTYKLFDVNHPQKYYIKRVVGLPGDTIEIKKDGLYRNGKKVDEPYAYYCKMHNESGTPVEAGPWTVEEDCVFVLGDNRNHSQDSRVLESIPQSAILGKVVKQ